MTTLFISDLHLDPAQPGITQQFLQFVARAEGRTEALYILGDLFEAWLGDDDPEPEYRRVVAALRKLRDSGTRIGFMHGNRDFLVGERFCAATGTKLLADPSVHEIGGVRTLLMHGDTLCTDDLDYQNWRRIARSETWQREFLAKPLAERRRAIIDMREKSKEVVQAKPADIMDVNDAAVASALRAHAVTRLVHGHTHRPGRHALTIDGRPAERWVLPDWYGRGGYLEIGRGAPRLVRF